MIIKHLNEVKEEPVIKANSTKTTVRWLITKEDGSQRFATRRFEIKTGGQVGMHSHLEDHHVYILKGTAIFQDGNDNKFQATKDDILYIPPNEPHSIINNGSEKFIFICIIPYV